MRHLRWKWTISVFILVLFIYKTIYSYFELAFTFIFSVLIYSKFNFW